MADIATIIVETNNVVIEVVETPSTIIEYQLGSGPQGPQGPTGPSGIQGIQGEIGPQGEVGATGSQGIHGEQGIQGETGPQGPAGNNGTNGTNGSNGSNGSDGVGVPVGGTAGQVLSKINSSDYNTEWVTVEVSGVKTYIQNTEPSVTAGTQFVWWDTSGGNLTIWVEDGL